MAGLCNPGIGPLPNGAGDFFRCAPSGNSGGLESCAGSPASFRWGCVVSAAFLLLAGSFATVGAIYIHVDGRFCFMFLLALISAGLAIAVDRTKP